MGRGRETGMRVGVGRAVLFRLALLVLVTDRAVVAGGGSPLADIGPAPAVVLTDAAGKPFDLARLRGKAVLVSFVYTTCGGTCPATTFQMVRVQKALKEAGLSGREGGVCLVTP